MADAVSEILIDPHRLRQFVAVAQYLNVTRAAEELQLTQQAVSSTLKILERDIGVPLLRRAGRRIELTAAGTALRDGAVPILDASEALRTARAASAGEHENFVIAHTPAISSDEVFDLTESVRHAYPGISITARQYFPDEIIPALRAGIAAIGLRRGATVPKNVAAATVSYTPLSVAVSSGHRLARRRSVVMSDIARESLILWGPPGESFY